MTRTESDMQDRERELAIRILVTLGHSMEEATKYNTYGVLSLIAEELAERGNQ